MVDEISKSEDGAGNGSLDSSYVYKTQKHICRLHYIGLGVLLTLNQIIELTMQFNKQVTFDLFVFLSLVTLLYLTHRKTKNAEEYFLKSHYKNQRFVMLVLIPGLFVLLVMADVYGSPLINAARIFWLAVIFWGLYRFVKGMYRLQNGLDYYLDVKSDKEELSHKSDPTSQSSQNTNISNEITNLKKLHEEGTLTDEEFKDAKAKLLDS